jgi:hypothetical protein
MLTEFNPENWKEIPIEVMRPHIEATNHVFLNLDYVGWNREDMKKNWRKRSNWDIVTINGVFPCFDAALVASGYFDLRGIKSRLRMVTDPKIVQMFRQNHPDAPCLHIDAWNEIEHNGKWYGMDLGAGDEYMVYPATCEKPRLEFPDEEVFRTTRPESGDRLWYRKTVILVSGDVVARNREMPGLELMLDRDNQVQVPMNLTPEEFRQLKISDPEEQRVFVDNKEYDIKGAREFNEMWIADFNSYWQGRAKLQGHPLPELMPIHYWK